MTTVNNFSVMHIMFRQCYYHGFYWLFHMKSPQLSTLDFGRYSNRKNVQLRLNTLNEPDHRR